MNPLLPTEFHLSRMAVLARWVVYHDPSTAPQVLTLRRLASAPPWMVLPFVSRGELADTPVPFATVFRSNGTLGATWRRKHHAKT
jgi:hypothetical protein